MPLPPSVANSLELPVVGSPLFIVSGPELVIAQRKAGIARRHQQSKTEGRER